MGLRFLTLYAFSSENWRRPSGEIGILMRLFEKELLRRRDQLVRLEARIRFIGRRDRLPDSVVAAMASLERATRECVGLRVQIAIDYGGRDELVRATRRIVEKIKSGKLAPEAVDTACLEAHLDTVGAPAPDVVLRTGGEQRLSNFLLWQSADAIFVSTGTPWPECRSDEISGAIMRMSPVSPKIKILTL